MEKLVNESKLIYFADTFNEKDIVINMKLGKIYEVETYAGETGDIVCKFISELESITIDDDWVNKEDYPDGFITELVFKNGVTINDPQYENQAVNICESDEDTIQYVYTKDGNTLRKWEYIAKALKNLKAPSKVTNATQELDNILVNLGLDYNTPHWTAYASRNKYQDECWSYLCSIIFDATYCSACSDINNNDVDCSCCVLSKGMGKDISCTPRSLYADDYYAIVSNYAVNKC